MSTTQINIHIVFSPSRIYLSNRHFAPLLPVPHDPLALPYIVPEPERPKNDELPVVIEKKFDIGE
eukprot:scaffold10399_cov113-Cylindrotheca_fusiformis.AAC.3